MSLLQAYLNNPRTQRALSRKPGDKGFSLIELVVVVAVLAILAAVAIPNFTALSDDARLNSAKNMLSTAYKECEFNEARTGTASHTAIAAAAIDGVTFSGAATKGPGDAGVCGTDAEATVVTGGVTCEVLMNFTTGAQTLGAASSNGTYATWPSNVGDGTTAGRTAGGC
jgi:prepilin-type N-terminal cleavage/methylation domain-containing protein